MKTLVTLLLILSSTLEDTAELNRIYKGVAEVESNSNPRAIGDGGKAFGIVQIHNIAVKDVNRLCGTNYKHRDAFNEEHAKNIFILYLSEGIKMFEDKYNRKPNEEEIVRMWNGGIYSGYRKETTKKYYKKYLKCL